MTPSLSSLNTSSLLKDLSHRVHEQIYQPVCLLEIQAWRSPEPLPFAARSEGTPTDLQIGDAWGKQLFDCAWFKFRATVPALDENTVLRIDVNGELCIVDPQGVPFRGLTCVQSEFDKSLGLPGKTICRVENWMVRDGLLEVWADAGFNDLFGRIQGEGRIALAEVAECRPDIRALYFDLEVLKDLHDCLEPGDPLRAKIFNAFAAAENCLFDFSESSVASARSSLGGVLARGDNPSSVQVSAIGHAHLDLAWLWPIRETIRKGARTLATVLYHLDNYPEYVFGCSQPQLFAWIKEYYPELYAKVRAAVAAGRIELQGTFWVEPDCNIPSGEALVRQIIYGSRFFREEFGQVPDYCWQPDVFGYNGQLPQILKKSGHRFFMTQKLSWSVVNRFPYQSFHWEGIDGSKILVHMPPEETYNGPAAPRSLRKIGETYAQRNVSDHALMVFGIGDGGGGPDGEHLERLRRGRALADLPATKIQPAGDFFEEWAADADKFPTWQGELYLERHQGTLTTQALTKRNNRQCEILLREAEWLSALGEKLCGAAYPGEELDVIWREALLYQFHDILPGSSIRRVYEESNARYAELLEKLQTIIAERSQLLLGHLGENSSHLILNSLPWSRTEWTQFGTEWRRVDVPAMGYCAWNGIPSALETPAPLLAESAKLESDLLRVTFARDGTIASIFDKASGNELLSPGEGGNRFAVWTDTGDAWDFAQDIPNKNPWLYLDQTPASPTLEGTNCWTDGPRALLQQTWKFQSSTIVQTISVESGGDKVVFATDIDWQEEKAMLRVTFPLSVVSDTAHFEIPFGSLQRSTREDTLIEKAQIEVAAQQWVALSDGTRGVGLLNDCKYGFRVKGSVIDMNLLRSVPHPGGALIGKEDKSSAEPNGIYTDLGQHHFRYAILPTAGTNFEAALTAAARAFNAPLQIISNGNAQDGSETASDSIFRLDNPAIDVSAAKRSEDRQHWIIRLCNVSPAPQTAALDLALPAKSIVETDLLENPLEGSPLDPAGLDFQPFEIKTLRVTLS